MYGAFSFPLYTFEIQDHLTFLTEFVHGIIWTFQNDNPCAHENLSNNKNFFKRIIREQHDLLKSDPNKVWSKSTRGLLRETLCDCVSDLWTIITITSQIHHETDRST